MGFVKWRVWLEEDLNAFHRQDYFLAQIAHLLAMANSKKPQDIKFDSFLMKFSKKQPETKGPITIEQARHKMLMSRAIWGGALGIEMPVDDLRPEDEPDVIKGPWTED